MSGTILPFRGRWPRIAADAFIAETAVVIGDVEIGAGSSVWYGCVIRGDVNRIRIGARSNVQDNAVIHCSHDPAGDYWETGGGIPTVVGDDVTVGHMALLHACTVEDRGFVGMRAVVMDEAVVESEAILAAGALLTMGKRVPRGELWAGSPAKRMRELGPEGREEIAYSARHYAELAAAYLAARED